MQTGPLGTMGSHNMDGSAAGATADRADLPRDIDGEADPQRRFAAFISYSHNDVATASWLQRRLETYRLPKGLASARGGARLGRVFRDLEDLAAATSLPDAIRDALALSDALVVLASPAAKASRWVNAEIALFRELHPDRPILAAIVDGELDAALPETLTSDGREPLAADLRPDGDGRRIGSLKLVAALWGLPLGALIDRDSLRRRKSVIAVTVAALLVMAILIAMTAFAIQSRNEAQRQRAEAEGLVEYMLTDLRTRLRGVGNISVMSAVNDRALNYYQQQGDLSALPDDSLERRARVLLAMGEDEMRRGNLSAAQARLANAFDSTEALLRRSPDNPDRVFAHAQSEFWVGDLARLQGDDVGHEQHMRRYAALADRLNRIDPDRVRALREVGYANGNLCALTARAASPPPTDHCSIALDAMRQVHRLRPDEQQAHVDLINRLSWKGESEFHAGRKPAAFALWDEALSEARQLVARDQDNRDSQDMLVATLLTRGRFGRDDDPQVSAGHLAEAEVIARNLSRFDPANERWRRLVETIVRERQRGAAN